ncbi:MAG TPA: 16S rRNA (adenine(1518)-N(6)/adenine(1519)-N(6))-dimethyltransferase RsmA [Syntrophales bacterium]|nr:16S rRNA (adenine(1518)-N(6)/adenine(1519)-N(6))-dimethyltransferase RsmA [Syntrophales bacterium]HOL59257.1 16S rRNA (adenine(1518)-N(6)/adenine(1519)-N(6))-dimethyltransferase RsmA [Syntrophales bacterium]HPO35307.1 16S rRNA (adenine(1518)-N(6)/adenine(1519)-N(6))-dimethyltransferase RsmA [Syntrophales bacterium]
MPESVWHPQKRWGQSFLHDANIVRKIVDLCDPKADEVFVEIGPGRGALSLPLAEKVKKLVAIEIDPYLTEALKASLGGISRVEVVQGDFLSFDLSTAARNLGVEKVKVVGNIPYSISGPILFRLLEARRWISTAVIMLQKEVAERLVAPPGSKEYGVPTVMFATYGRVQKAFTVSAHCFYPRPQVTSSVVRIDFSSQPLGPIVDEHHFHSLVRNAFAHRRKTLLNNLLKGYGKWVDAACLKAILDRLGIGERVRAEAIPPRTFIELSNVLISFMRE